VWILFSTMFLMGPLKQLKRMCDKSRALATGIMIVRIHTHIIDCNAYREIQFFLSCLLICGLFL